MTTVPPADRARNALRLFMLIAMYAIPVVVALRPVATPLFDPDIWWHLRVGEWVLAHGEVPTTDPFTDPPDKPWVAYSWLYETLVYGLYRHLGLLGIVLYRVALALAVTAALHALVARREPHFLAATLLTAAGLYAIAGLFSERPWLFTILFSLLTLGVVLDLREGRRSRWRWLLPVVFALWANLHIQFIYGLALLVLACVAPWLDRALGFGPFGVAPAVAGTRAWWRLVLLTALCFLATLVNPYAGRIYGVVVEYATQPGAFRYVNELKALEFREPCDWVVVALGGAAAFALGRRVRLSSFDLLLLAGAAACAFRARRDIWLLVVVSLATLTPLFRLPPPDADSFRFTLPRALGVALGLALIGLVVAWQRDLSADRLRDAVAEKFPVRAAAEVAQRGYPGPLFNDFNWGGYLIWALPHHAVIVDGRTNLHGDDKIERIGSVWAGGSGWRSDPDLARANVVIAPADSVLGGLLHGDPRFERVYADKVACVYVARPAAAEPW